MSASLGGHYPDYITPSLLLPHHFLSPHLFIILPALIPVGILEFMCFCLSPVLLSLHV